MTTSARPERYLAPGWFTRHVLNRVVALATSAGVSVWGSRSLRVRGRTSGEWRSTPVNLLTYEGRRYLVSPRGITQWVRNLRVAGAGELRLGRRVETFVATEVSGPVKVEVLRAYLARWSFEVGTFFDGVSATSPPAEFERVAAGHPVFLVEVGGSAV